MNPNDLPPEDQPERTEEEVEEDRREMTKSAREELEEHSDEVLKVGDRVSANEVEYHYYRPEDIDPLDYPTMKSMSYSWEWITNEEYLSEQA
ncbi:hypothetical protein [Halorubrum ezzemoulense]|uniref:hypothetical protein n=1 Tax=Halorubrum ezzemoulense TaxID=337243 RepID=UPI00113FF40B|nr:hypothetical protein [Halorubrum ezzemoulense]